MNRSEAWAAAVFWVIVGFMTRTLGNYIWEQGHLKVTVPFEEGLTFGVLWILVIILAIFVTAYAARKEGTS